MAGTGDTWRPGLSIAVRGARWTIVERTPFADCEALRLAGAERSNRAVSRTILVPFDRPRRVAASASTNVLRPRRWLRALYGAIGAVTPLGGLSRAAFRAIELMPYQLEPALAILRHGQTRVLIADGVGLGKTIQAGLVLDELASRSESCRALVVAPAGLRHQWAGELAARFGIEATIVTSTWLARTVSMRPADVNPWSLPGIYIASFDFIKRPEVLRPMEDVQWDALVVDEAHAATLGTARRAAVHAVSLRARRVILLSATPHAGDSQQFHALCDVGKPSAHAQSLWIFRRGPEAGGRVRKRRTVLLPIRLSANERRMHRLLEGYTSRVCLESRSRGDLQARLAAMALAKRALSSATSLAISCRRRLALLASAAPSRSEEQLLLPLGDEEPIADDSPDAILAAPGLADAGLEARWLSAIADAADRAAAESKLEALVRLLRRVREPAIVFTEFRDTLERLREALAGSGRRATLLHGGMSAQERIAAQQEFNENGSLLLATDAAAEGLNLHERCRMVVHFELPWSPARLEQRTGRVDRIGQQRVVHEIVFVANDTAERMVLAPLARRAARARAALPGANAGLYQALTESRVAAAVMEGSPLIPETIDPPAGCVPPPPGLADEARAEAMRLAEVRHCCGRSVARTTPGGIVAMATRARASRLPSGIVAVFQLSLIAADGNVCHSELIAAHQGRPDLSALLTPAQVRSAAEDFKASRLPTVEAAVMKDAAARVQALAAQYRASTEALAERQAATSRVRRSAARALVQGALFGIRPVRAEGSSVGFAGDEAPEEAPAAFDVHLTPELSLRALLFITRA